MASPRRYQKKYSPYGSPNNKIWLKKNNRTYYYRYRPASAPPLQLVSSADKLKKAKQAALRLIYSPMWKTWNGVKPERVFRKALQSVGKKPKYQWTRRWINSLPDPTTSPAHKGPRTPPGTPPATPLEDNEPPTATSPDTEKKISRIMEEEEADAAKTPLSRKNLGARRKLCYSGIQEANQGLEDESSSNGEEDCGVHPLVVTPLGTPKKRIYMEYSPISSASLPISPTRSTGTIPTSELLDSPGSPVSINTSELLGDSPVSAQPSTALQCPTPPHYAYYSSFTPLLDQLIDFSEEMDEHETKMEKARQDLEDACRYFRQAVNGQEEEDANNNQDEEDNAQNKDAEPLEVDLTDQD